MRQIPLLQGKALLVELPEGLGEYNMFLWDAYYDVTGDFHEVPSLTSTHKDPDKTRILLPEGNWRIIGMLSEVTEAEALELVDSDETQGAWPFADVFTMDYRSGRYTLSTALESLESAILAEGWYFENPLENEQKRIGLGTLDNFDQDYEQAQSRVLDRSRCLLLGREDA